MVRLALLALAVLSGAAPAAAADAWLPPLPQIEFHKAPPAPAGRLLDEKVLAPGLALIAKSDVGGLGAEAARADAWRAGRSSVRLGQGPSGPFLVDGSGAALPLSPAMGSALSRIDSYFGLTGPTLAHPIKPEELRAAFLTPAAAEAVARVFERTVAERIVVRDKAYLPELGGELTLDAGLSFHFHDDLLRPLLRELVARRQDPAALERLYAEQPRKMELLDPQGILKRTLETRRRWDAEGRIPKEKRDAMLAMSVDTVVELAAGHYSGDASTQLKTMISDDWSGRYAGTWHCHPPDEGKDGFVGDYPPSDADYEAAMKTGEEIVIAYVADGYDVYQLSTAVTGGKIATAAPLASYRSPSWRGRFQSLFNRAFARP